MTHWTPPNRGVTSDLKSVPHGGSSFPLMGTTMGTQFRTAPTDGGTLVRRSGLAKSGDPTSGGKANRRNVPLGERGGCCGGVQVKRIYVNEPIASATGRNVYRMPSAFSAADNFRSEARRS